MKKKTFPHHTPYIYLQHNAWHIKSTAQSKNSYSSQLYELHFLQLEYDDSTIFKILG